MTVLQAIIHIVDDDGGFRRAVARLLEAAGYRVMIYPSAEEFVRSPMEQERGCILLDLQMPGAGGLELQDQLRETGSLLPIVFLTGHGTVPASVRALKGGAEDFLPKPVAKEDLIDAIQRALARYDLAFANASRQKAATAQVSTLTPREKQVLALLVRGKLHKQIAFELGTAERTVKAHRHSIMEKLGVRSLAEAVLIADRVGITLEADDAVGRKH